MLVRAFDDKQLLIADGHHRYETAVAFSEEEGTPASAQMLVVLVSTDDPGLEIFPTHRALRGAEAPRRREHERRSRSSVDRGHAAAASRGRRTSRSGMLDVQLVDTPRATRGSPTRRAPTRRGARVATGEAAVAYLLRADADRGRVRLRAPRRGDAAEDDVLLPEADQRPALPPAVERRGSRCAATRSAT